MNWLVEFLFPQRLHRLAFFLRLVVSDIMPACLYFINPEIHPRYFLGFYIVLLIYSIFFIILPRVRDVGMSAWWLLILFVPIAGALFLIILLFRAPKNYGIAESVLISN